MRLSTILALVLAVVFAAANPLSKRDWTTSMTSTTSTGLSATSQSPSEEDMDMITTNAMNSCYPHNATGHLDFNAPCNQATAILSQCAYGPRALDILTLS
jgi:hypothetical protein